MLLSLRPCFCEQLRDNVFVVSLGAVLFDVVSDLFLITQILNACVFEGGLRAGVQEPLPGHLSVFLVSVDRVRLALSCIQER